MVLCKAPIWGLGRASTKLRRLDSTEKTRALHTTARLDALHLRRASSDAKVRQRAERDQLTRLLKESDAKRDARNYIKHFDVVKKVDTPPPPTPTAGVTGVNLGALYAPTVFTREPLPESRLIGEEPLHLALVKLRQPQALDDATLGGIAGTLGRLAQLGLSTAVVLDCDDDAACATAHARPPLETTIRQQAARVVAALARHNEPGAVLVEHALRHAGSLYSDKAPSTAHVRGDVEVSDNYLLFPPIDDGVIPVIPPFAFDADLKRVTVLADDVVLALVREFGGLTHGTARIESTTHSHQDVYERPILDRIIILDPLGGIPSRNRADGAHVFVNLEAEYRDIKEELRAQSHGSQERSGNETQFVDDRHIKNLNVVERALKLLPPSSSGLILTPLEAATDSLPSARQKPAPNPLIHNILTDKPMVSSSLPTPISRLHASHAPNPSTFLKKGIPLTMIPDPRTCGPWQPPTTGYPSIDLANDPRINLPKLVALINDSFRRKLDPKDYLRRVEGRVAGIIIAGDYEGGAICTWEKSPDTDEWVPYLDKFAVLTSSQGSGGVSDIVWAALVRTCFPKGVVWRSRTSNPVNKWYQERSAGMWNLPGGQWTMFWTVEGVGEHSDEVLSNEVRSEAGDASKASDVAGDEVSVVSVKSAISRDWDAYVHVCSGIEPSWAS